MRDIKDMSFRECQSERRRIEELIVFFSGPALGFISVRATRMHLDTLRERYRLLKDRIAKLNEEKIKYTDLPNGPRLPDYGILEVRQHIDAVLKAENKVKDTGLCLLLDRFLKENPGISSADIVLCQKIPPEGITGIRISYWFDTKENVMRKT